MEHLWQTTMADESAVAIVSQDYQETGEMTSMTPAQQATVQRSSNPFLGVVQEDEYSGGVQFNADGNMVETHAYTILKSLLFIGVGIWVGKNWF